jgi:hypothetical protein
MRYSLAMPPAYNFVQAVDKIERNRSIAIVQLPERPNRFRPFGRFSGNRVAFAAATLRDARAPSLVGSGHNTSPS